MEITLMCDMRVCDSTTTFGIFCRRFGVPLIDGGTVRLPHLIGLSRAIDLILTGRPVKGKEAFQIGLANRLVPDGSTLTEGFMKIYFSHSRINVLFILFTFAAIKLANEISQYPQECMNKDRLSAYYAMYSAKSFEDAITNEMKHGLEVIHKV